MLRKITVKWFRVNYGKNGLKRGEWFQRALKYTSSRLLEMVDEDFGLDCGKEKEEKKRDFEELIDGKVQAWLLCEKGDKIILKFGSIDN